MSAEFSPTSQPQPEREQPERAPPAFDFSTFSFLEVAALGGALTHELYRSDTQESYKYHNLQATRSLYEAVGQGLQPLIKRNPYLARETARTLAAEPTYRRWVATQLMPNLLRHDENDPRGHCFATIAHLLLPAPDQGVIEHAGESECRIDLSQFGDEEIMALCETTWSWRSRSSDRYFDERKKRRDTASGELHGGELRDAAGHVCFAIDQGVREVIRNDPVRARKLISSMSSSGSMALKRESHYWLRDLLDEMNGGRPVAYIQWVVGSLFERP
ncbi:hypothetical protein [Nocardia mexicana]|uniref:Uncharacterized protein n=1 Tax=Nocardia mexicana TaxID=279262 RepID=A0A370HB40_9NOCA|nr:hypothetical protein [Nocardia mexicana]RDI54010.1 hypothetical protein DFR68_102131 [Nocardia mexicana]